MKPMNDETSLSRDQLAREARECMSPPRILLAEDEAEMRALLAEVLEEEGYSVVQVEDGLQLLDELAGSMLGDDPAGFDLVISDIRMPGCTGLEVLEGLRASDWQTRFVLITAFGDAETHAEAYRLGGVVLDKPFMPEDLLQHVRAMVSPRRYHDGWSTHPAP